MESDLTIAQKAILDRGRLLKKAEKEKQAAKVEARRMGEGKKVIEAKYKDLEQEKYQMRKELEKLQATSNMQRKELQDLRVRFTVKKEALTEDYQKQVDEMFFFGYQCCIRKNGITQDIPSYPFDENDATVSGPAQENKNPNVVGPFDR